VRVLLPLPDRDFDVTEVAVPWAVLRDAGHEVVFATEKAGTVPAADPRLLTGVLFGQFGAAPEARKRYYELVQAPEFGATEGWTDLDPAGFDGLILPGGHAPCPPAAPRLMTGRPSSCATAATCPPAGRATRTCSPAGSATCSSPVLYPERTGLPALLHVPRPRGVRSAC
jgi:ThiJ/PfpI family-like